MLVTFDVSEAVLVELSAIIVMLVDVVSEAKSVPELMIVFGVCDRTWVLL